MERIARCCPHLQELHFVKAVRERLQLTALQQLSELSKLTLGGPVPDDEGLSAAVLQLTGLHLKEAKSLGPEGLVSLTRLTQVTLLRVEKCGLDDSDEVDWAFDCELVSKVSEHPASHVWSSRHYQAVCHVHSSILKHISSMACLKSSYLTQVTHTLVLTQLL